MSELMQFLIFLLGCLGASIFCAVLFLSTVYLEKKFDLNPRPSETPGFQIIVVMAVVGLVILFALHEFYVYLRERKYVEDLRGVFLIGKLFGFILVAPPLMMILAIFDIENEVREKVESFLEQD